MFWNVKVCSEKWKEGHHQGPIDITYESLYIEPSDFLFQS